MIYDYLDLWSVTSVCSRPEPGDSTAQLAVSYGAGDSIDDLNGLFAQLNV